MKHTKLLAVFAVLVMILGSVTCIVAASENDSASNRVITYSVTLDASKDFTANKSELNKLGITDPSSWIKDGTGTTLVLDNLYFSTSKSKALTINGTCSNFKIVVKGENTIACGGQKIELTDFVDALIINDGIAKTTITGDGSLTLRCNGLAEGYGGTGLYVINDLVISKCKLTVGGPSLFITTEEQGRYVSNGIYITDGVMTVTDGARVLACGGDIETNGICFYEEEQQSTKSTGIRLTGVGAKPTLVVKDSTVVGVGGDVLSEAPGLPDPSVGIDVRSSGVYVKGDIVLNNSVLRGYGGTAEGKDSSTSPREKVLSEGMRFKGNITATSSEISAYGGEAISNEMAVSAGIRHFANLDDTEQGKKLSITLNDCDLYAFGGSSTGDDTTARGKLGGSFGLFASEIGTKAASFELTITLKESIAFFNGSDDYKGSSIGLSAVCYDTSATPYDTLPRGIIVIDGSELYTDGYTKGIYAESVSVKDKDYKYCKAGSAPHTPDKNVQPSELNGNYKCAVIGYHYNLFTVLEHSIYSPIMAYVYDVGMAKLPDYEINYMPEGQKFKCWSIDGVEYKPGEYVDLSEGPLTAVAVFEKDTSSDDNSGLILIIVIVIVAIIVLLLIAAIMLRKPSVAEKSETKQMKNVAKPKAVAKKTTAKKPVAKKVAKPKAKNVAKPKAAVKKTTTKKPVAKKVSKPKAKKVAKPKVATKKATAKRPAAKKTTSKKTAKPKAKR